MKKLLLLAAAGSLFIASQASAALMHHDLNHEHKKLSEHGRKSVSGTWSFGAIESDETITEIITKFTFSDKKDRTDEDLTISVATRGVDDYIFNTPDFELGRYKKFVFNFTSSFVATGLSTFTSWNSLVADAMDGKISYKVEIDNNGKGKNDFKFRDAEIWVKTTKFAVMDSGTTLALLGLGILGLAGVRRRVAK